LVLAAAREHAAKPPDGDAGYSLIDGNVKVLPNHVLAYDWLNVHGVTWRVYHQGFFPFFSMMPRWLPEIATSDKFREFDRFAIDMELESDATFPQVIFVETDLHRRPHDEQKGRTITRRHRSRAGNI